MLKRKPESALFCRLLPMATVTSEVRCVASFFAVSNRSPNLASLPLCVTSHAHFPSSLLNCVFTIFSVPIHSNLVALDWLELGDNNVIFNIFVVIKGNPGSVFLCPILDFVESSTRMYNIFMGKNLIGFVLPLPDYDADV